MPRLEILLQFIVPLTFLAIWALTSLLNRDAQPLPPRPGRGPVPDAWRPGALPPTRGDSISQPRHQGSGRLASPLAERPTGARWAGAQGQGRPGLPGRGVGPDDGIVIIESDTRGPSQPGSQFPPSGAVSTRGARGAAARRGTSRGRSVSGAAPAKSVESERPRALTGLVSQSLSQKKARPLEIAPLATPITPISSTPLTQSSAGPTTVQTAGALLRPALTGTELRAMFASPNKLREVALLTEILQPPVALRGRRRSS
jgi:hypothetical protein